MGDDPRVSLESVLNFIVMGVHNCGCTKNKNPWDFKLVNCMVCELHLHTSL